MVYAHRHHQRQPASRAVGNTPYGLQSRFGVLGIINRLYQQYVCTSAGESLHLLLVSCLKPAVCRKPLFGADYGRDG